MIQLNASNVSQHVELGCMIDCKKLIYKIVLEKLHFKPYSL